MATKAQICFFDRAKERRATGSPVKVFLFKEQSSALLSSFKFVYERALVQLPRCKRSESIHLLISFIKWIGVPVLWYYGQYGSWFWNMVMAILPIGLACLVLQLVLRVRPKAYYIYTPLFVWEVLSYLVPAYLFTEQVLGRWYIANRDIALTVLIGLVLSQIGATFFKVIHLHLEHYVLGGHFERLKQKLTEGFSIGPNPFIHSFLGLFLKIYRWFV
ncbi:hypothetical protein [Persicobacter psychrovividus]|uniref:N-terminal Ras-GEF domain-containing protein n=1 Tax=Persicobacter psychrovividus TaxID=387638 RepID=A0ABN6LBR1_9BACT|nr:hypothetical protein PEPS_25290 [Persicobacter psychrovividus]